MKIRIRGDSLRLRLSQTEVQKLGKGDFVQDVTHFPDGSKFVYRLELNQSLAMVEAHYKNGEIVVRVPAADGIAWAHSDKVEIKASQPLPDLKKNDESASLFILIEKDFQCLKVRDNENEDESDLFVHPNAHSGRCG